MDNSNQILLVHDMDLLGLEQIDLGLPSLWWISRGENPLGINAILKFSDYPVCELFGYLLASLIGIPAPRCRGVWFNQKIKLPDRKIIQAGQIKVLIEYLSNLRRVYPEDLARDGKYLLAKYLLFELFGRDEASQLFMHDRSVVILDLERCGPAMSTGWTEDWLRDMRDGYARDSEHWLFDITCDLAVEYGVMEEFRAAVEKFSRISFDNIVCRLSVFGHPESELMSKIFISGVTKRLAICANSLSLPAPKYTNLDVFECSNT